MEIINENKRRVPVRIYNEHYLCDCGGDVIYESGMVTVATYPIQYYHKCNKCGKTYSLTEKFPRVVYEEEKIGMILD